MSRDTMADVSPLSTLDTSEREEIARSVLSRVTAAGAVVVVNSNASANAGFTRNEVDKLTGSNNATVSLKVDFNGKRASAITDRIDPDGLSMLVEETEIAAKQNRDDGEDDTLTLSAPAPFVDPVIYYNSSVNAGLPKSQGELIRAAATMTEQAQLIGAGNLRISSYSTTVMNTLGVNACTRSTFGEYSVTGRTKSGKGSGWAWYGSEDFSKVDPAAITTRAIDIAHKSDNPVAVEPGRYTVILEPEALASLVDTIVSAPTRWMDLRAANSGGTVFSMFNNKRPAGNKIGLQMADRRMQISHNPHDPELPFSPLNSDGSITKQFQWFKDGVLQALAYRSLYGRANKLTPESINSPASCRMDFTGKPSTLDEMVSSVDRGVWVHRLSSITVVNGRSLLLSGVTRDGTFLIEHGKITKPIKNFRFLESPFFVLGKVEAFGTPVRASTTLLLPRLMVRDFEFTSLSDAV